MYKSTTGLQTFKGCPIRLRELNTSRNKGPTSMQGGSISNGNAIRRRVARVSYNKGNEPVKASYGPLLVKENPFLGGNCTDKALHMQTQEIVQMLSIGRNYTEDLDL